MRITPASLLFCFGVGLLLTGFGTYYLQLTPLIFFFDRPWPSLNITLALIMAGLGISGITLWRHRNMGKTVIVFALLALSAWFVATTYGQYREEQIGVINGTLQLDGTLLTPRGDGPFPAVIFLHGTAPNTRTPYRGLAEHFVRNGIATLVYDKRGFGGSTGILPYTYAQLADDVVGVVQRLRHHPHIAAEQIGVLGFSEGGFVGPLAAAQTDDIAFMILVSGSAVSPARTVHYEMAQRLVQAGHSTEEVEQALALQQQVDDYFRSGEQGDAAWSALRAATKEPWFAKAFELAPDALPASFAAIPFTADYPSDLDFDPLPHLAQLEIPLLFLFGASDRQIPVGESVQALETTLGHVEHHNFTIRIFADADHLLLIDYRPAPGYLETITAWILRHTGENHVGSGQESSTS